MAERRTPASRGAGAAEPSPSAPDARVRALDAGADDPPPGASAPRSRGATPAAARTAARDQELADLRARLARAEEENARLRAAAAQRPPAVVPGAAAPPRPRRRPGRATAAVVALVVAGLLAPVAVVAAWAQGLVTDTDRYLATVAPLADDPQVQQAVTSRVTGAIVDAINLDQLAQDATTAVSELGLPPRLSTAVLSLQGPLVDAATGFVRNAVERVVTSDAFSAAWTAANRAVQTQLVAVLSGDPDALASLDSSGTLTVDLSDVVAAVTSALSDAGFTIVDRLPTINASFALVQSADLVRLQSAYRLLDALGTWLPWIVLGLLAVGVVLARHTARALVVAGLVLAGAMLLLGLGLAVGRSVYASSLPPQVQRPDAAVVVYDQVVSLLRVALRSVLVLGLVVALVAFVAGDTAAARALRRSWSRMTAWLRGAGERRGVTTGPVGVWLDEQRVLVRSVVGGGAALALVLADRLTPAYVVTVAVAAVMVLALTTLAARPRTAVVAGPGPDVAASG